ncbi:MAG: efflux RND transporter permease subunit [Bacteroidota bacterium]|nr:efflux RND transporter permease subunit [Bacteroidota bacterium]
MKPWNIAVDNRVAVYILILIILVLGLQSYFSLPREAAPDVNIPYVIVSVPYVGISPTDVEGLVTQPLERELKAVKDIKQITSNSGEGLATIFVEFNTGVDIDEAVRRVRDKVNSSRTKLPADIREPIVREINFSEFPIMYIAVGGTVGLPRLKNVAEHIKDQVETIPGVLSVDMSGALEPEIQVNCDVNRMKGYQISFDDVVSAIRGEHLNVPGGAIDNGETDFTVRVPGEFESPKPIADIVVKMRNGEPIYVRDVAEVRSDFEDRKSYSRLNGEPVVTLAVRKRAGENIVDIAEKVKEIVERQRATLPQGVTIDITNDQSTIINRMVHELENSIFTGMALVILVLFMFFGIKNAALISTAIPLSMLIGFIILSVMGVTLNFVVLFALVLVLGIVVDDAIVVIENIYRHQHEYGKGLIEAAKDATREVSVPVATSTFTTVAAFIPLLFWPGVVGDFMKYLPITLISTMLASLFVAYVISPVQGSKFINYRKEIEKAKWSLEHPSRWRRYNPFTVTYHWVNERFFPAAQQNYLHVLQFALRHKTGTLAGAFGLLVLVVLLFGAFNTGVVFFPDMEPRLVTVNITMPPGTPLGVTDQVTREVERRIAALPGYRDVEFMVANVGVSNSPFDFGAVTTANKASVAVNFYEKAKRSTSPMKTLEQIRAVTADIPGADITAERQQMGPPVGAAVSIELIGEDIDQLHALSRRIQKHIKTIPGLVDLKDDYNVGKPEIQVVVDREKAALLEMSTGQIAGVVRTAVNGTQASKFRVGEDEYNITVRLREDQRTSPADIENLNITFMNRRGALLSVPLLSVADVVRSSGLSNIRRKDLKRVVTITGDVQGRLANDVLKDVKARLASYPLPAGYDIQFTGQQEEQTKASAFLFRALIITLLLVFLIIVTEFNSVKIPLVIMVSVFLSFIGVFLGLLVTRIPFNIVMSGVGVIALVGIVVKNAIVLLDFTKQIRREGRTLEDSLLAAGRVRLRPVILTAVSTILGVVPLATGVDFDWRAFHFVVGAESGTLWRPLAVTIIFGLGVSTFLTLVIVPTFFAWLEEKTGKATAAVRSVFTRAAVHSAAGEIGG